MIMRGIFDLTGKVAAVIGGASGIGEAVALGCAQHGARVACLDINEQGASDVAGHRKDSIREVLRGMAVR